MKRNETVERMQELLDQCSEQGTQRDMALLAEAYQVYGEYLEEVEIEPSDKSVTVKMDGTTVKFQDEDSFASWLAERMA